MTPEQFVFWMKGIFDLKNDFIEFGLYTMNEDQQCTFIGIIENKLNQIVNSYSDNESTRKFT